MNIDSEDGGKEIGEQAGGQQLGLIKRLKQPGLLDKADLVDLVNREECWQVREGLGTNPG